MNNTSAPPVVVVGVDGSTCSQSAVRWATEYAHATGATLKLVTAWHWPSSYGVRIGYGGSGPEEDARKVVEAAASGVALPLDQIEKAVVLGPAGDVLVDSATEAQLLVVGTRGHGALTSALIGSTSNYCVHHAHCPVVVVR